MSNCKPDPDSNIVKSSSNNICTSDDTEIPICREFVNQGNCRKRKQCYFNHPQEITSSVVKKATRQLGYCYCGAPQKRIIINYGHKFHRNNNHPMFFVVCSRTNRSLKRCL
jgi:hypothetical protein